MAKLSTKHWLFIGMALLWVLNLIQAKYSLLIDDEAYYWMWSQRLDWGYFDHPPMIALWIYLGDLFSADVLGTRLIATVAYSLIFWICFELFGIKTRRELALLFAVILSFVLITPFGFVSTPDTPLLFFSFLYFWALKLFLDNSNWRNTIFLGFCFAALLYSKYHGVLIIAFSLLPTLGLILNKKAFYAATIFGILLYVPHLWWQVEHDFISFHYHIVRRNVFNHFKFSNTTDYVLAVLWTGAPLLLWHSFKSFFQKNTPFVRALKGASIGIILFFLLTTLKRYIQAQWLLAATIPVALLIFNHYRNKREAHKWIFILGGISFVLFALGRVYFTLDNPPLRNKYLGLKDCMMQAGDKNKGLAVWETYQEASLFKFYNRDQEVIRYRTLENRNSQFELWDDQERMHNLPITYYSGYASTGDDSIKFERREPHRVMIFYLDTVQAAHHVEIKTLERTTKSDSVYLRLRLINHHPHSVDLTASSNLNLSVVYMNGPYLFDTKYSQNLPLPNQILEAGDSLTQDFVYPEMKESGTYWYYPSLYPKGLPARRSNETKGYEVVIP